jgi:PAP2 superfamily
MKPSHWHYSLSLGFGAAMIPVLRSQGLPLKFDWLTLGIAYWVFLASEAIFVATIFWLVGMPRPRLELLFARHRADPLRVVAIVIYFALLVWITTGTKALVLTVDTIAILGLLEHQKAGGIRQAAAAILPPAAYFFFGFLVVLGFNTVIVSARSNFATDPAFAAADRWLLHGHSVSGLSHWAVQSFPLYVFHFLEFVYFEMFPQLGASIILLSLSYGKVRGLQFVGAILLSYYMALCLFYLWPAQGPYYLCPDHFSRFPGRLQTYAIQKALIAHALALFHHQPIARISTDYFIAFPSMHIAQPVIMLWFLRRWKRIVIALAVYDVLLIAAILLLEEHYVVDLLAGVLVAIIAIWITENPLRWHPHQTRVMPPAKARA